LYAQAYIPGGNVNGIHVERNSLSVLPEKIQFKNFTIEQGLSSNYVQSIIQDSKGFLWAGTMN